MMSRTLPICILVAVFTAYCTPAQTGRYCQVKLRAGDPSEHSGFGDALAIDGNTIVVGAPFKDGTAPGEGAAYVYEYADGAWTQTAKLAAADPAAEDRFGASFALKGDLLVVGAPFADRGLLPDAGAAYVFRRVSGAWTQTARLRPSLSTPLALFGFSIDSDGHSIVVGAPGAGGAGAAYVFVESGAGWTQTAVFTASQPAPGAFFGDALRLSGDTIVVGAPGFPNAGLQGAVYVYEKPPGGWMNAAETAQLTASDGAVDDFFGDAVAIADRLIIVGAEGANHSGAAYLYRKPAGGWQTTAAFDAKLLPDDPSEGAEFGDSIAVEGQTWVFSAEGDSANGERSGAAYLFIDGQQRAKILSSDIAARDHFGQAVAISNDVLLIGAPDDDDGANRAGAVYVFRPCS